MGSEECPTACYIDIAPPMDVIRVKVDEFVLVHERYMLFRFQVSPSAQDHAHIDFYFPLFDNDGRPAPMDNLKRETIEIGETFALDFEGDDEGLVPSGVVEITVSSIEGDDVTLYV